MNMFGDRIVEAIRQKGTPCIVGLDPRLDLMPDFVTRRLSEPNQSDAIRATISEFHERVIGLVADTVPAVKLQIAFYEQYGLPGMEAFAETIALARSAGLVVLVDAKRNDIGSTAAAYANAFLGGAPVLGRRVPAFDVDCITVSPFLGRDSLEPFVAACRENGKGILVLVKTSNPGSGEIQDCPAGDGETISMHLAKLVDALGDELVGESGYSSVGAVVGATFPEEARRLRDLMPKAIILVPGYGAQGGTATDAAENFNLDGAGAMVNASRSITYEFGGTGVSQAGFDARLSRNLAAMITDVNAALTSRAVL